MRKKPVDGILPRTSIQLTDRVRQHPPSTHNLMGPLRSSTTSVLPIANDRRYTVTTICLRCFGVSPIASVLTPPHRRARLHTHIPCARYTSRSLSTWGRGRHAHRLCFLDCVTELRTSTHESTLKLKHTSSSRHNAVSTRPSTTLSTSWRESSHVRRRFPMFACPRSDTRDAATKEWRAPARSGILSRTLLAMLEYSTTSLCVACDVTSVSTCIDEAPGPWPRLSVVSAARHHPTEDSIECECTRRTHCERKARRLVPNRSPGQQRSESRRRAEMSMSRESQGQHLPGCACSTGIMLVSV
ncbi:uncharacterized protein C8Q71DRAFT_768672 [Rhodofomes roseus]|uniref:Uncharacterized protein n=1 Tax=Rhodofomes roseus TaxID=34475 RepID=A0ABQ8KAF5_9APHY|nr:uncharacterized protein C8Q71DRAFT_768672 [Rhodofomes roseus]KAH9834423.1 hypothetical protein C8Q71DRAFT_768672 [Rhodofomes roseus]